MRVFDDVFGLDENKLQIKNIASGKRASLTLNQVLLLQCLMEKKGKKKEIIKYIWEDNDVVVSDGSYHQLIFQTRALFESIGLSPDLIKTYPRYGVKLVNAATTNEEVAMAHTSTTRKSADVAREKHCEAEDTSNINLYYDGNSDERYSMKCDDLIGDKEENTMSNIRKCGCVLSGREYILAIICFVGSIFCGSILAGVKDNESYKAKEFSSVETITLPRLVMHNTGKDIKAALRASGIINEWLTSQVNGLKSPGNNIAFINDYSVYQYVRLCPENMVDSKEKCQNLILR